MIAAEKLELERELHDAIELLRSREYAVERVDRVLRWDFRRALTALEDVVAGIAFDGDTGARIPGSIFTDDPS